MRFVLLVTLLAHASANSGFLVAPLIRTTASTLGIKAIDNHRGFVPRVLPRVLQKKASFYVASFELGGQKQTAVIDTGSADLWVFGKKSGAKVTYDTRTGEDLEMPFRVRYLDGDVAKGGYFLDDFVWGDIKLKLQFGVSNNKPPESDFGILGIGDKSHEAAVYVYKNDAYENLPSILKMQGLTQSVSYSLNLRGTDKDSGSLVFGAFDTSRFLGRLKVFDVNMTKGFRVSFKVNGKYQIAELDSGTTFSFFDSDVVDEIVTGFGAVWDESEEVFMVSEMPDSDLVFDFNGVRVTVPSSELWQEHITKHETFYHYYLTILPNTHTKGQNLLGISFLRSAYVIFDLDNKQVAVGQAASNRSPSNYVTIGPEGIPPEYII